MSKKIILFLFVLICQVVFAQSDSITKPKIGLVLSGGGAKGLAHIGVLKIIEQAGVKIDYIGGTSMGAIIGGLYASGYTAHQLDSIFNATDYSAVIQDYTPRSSKNFYEKRNDELYALTLPFNKLKISIPAALSKGLYNYSLINRLTHHVYNVKNFEKLPIPFVCIATDIEKGEEVVLREGYLTQALLASGAFPSLYSPVIIGNRYLIDGGVENNYPVEEVKKMGADIIIGVDVQDDLKDRKDLKDATRILVQISNLQMSEKMKKNRRLTDIYIKPDIGNFSVISFEQGSQIIKKGEEAGIKVLEKLEQYSSKYIKKQTIIPKKETDSLFIEKITPSNLENYTRAYIIGKLRFKTNSKISYSDLRKGIENLNATQNFSNINYILNKTEKGRELEVNLSENTIKTYLKFGLHYDGLYKSGVLVNFTQKKLFFKNDVFSTDIVLGDNFRYNSDYYIDNGFYLSFGIKSRYNSFNRNVKTDFADGSILTQAGISSINIDFSDFTNQVYLQSLFIQKFIIGAGLELKHLKIRSRTLQDTNPVFDNSDYFSLFGYLKYDSFDNKYFPKEGWYFNGDIQTFLFSSNYSNMFTRFSILKSDMAFAKTVLKKATLIIQTEGGFAVGEQTVPFLNFVLGGYGYNTVNNFRHFYGYDFLSLSGNSYVKGAITLDYEIFKKNHLNFTTNYANIGNNLFENTENWLKHPSYSGYAFGYGIETILGPIEIKHSWSPETRDHHTWFAVGFWF